jgi:hypothetical protein
MKTKVIELFDLSELSEEAQQKAHADYLNLGDFYHWQGENAQTLKAFTDLFNIKLDRDGDYKSIYNGSNFEDLESLSGPRLLSYLWNRYGKEIFKPKVYHNKGYTKTRQSKLFTDPFNCIFTGYCMDVDIIAPIVEYMRGQKEIYKDGKLKIERVKFPKNLTFEDLLRDCIQEFNQAVNRDYEEAQSFEQFKDTSEANEWTYTENGKFER